MVKVPALTQESLRKFLSHIKLWLHQYADIYILREEARKETELKLYTEVVFLSTHII
jgi:hypothetical protein